MKSNTLPAGFPTNPDDWEKLIAAAPERVDDPDCPYDPNDPAAVEAYWQDAVMVRGGGYPAVKAAVDECRGQRGPQKSPVKISTTLRLPPEVVAYFKATGPGWQTRIGEALKEWIKEHPSG